MSDIHSLPWESVSKKNVNVNGTSGNSSPDDPKIHTLPMKNSHIIGCLGIKHLTSSSKLNNPPWPSVISYTYTQKTHTHTHLPFWQDTPLTSEFVGVRPGRMTSLPFGNLTGASSLKWPQAWESRGRKEKKTIMIIIIPSHVMSRAHGPQYITAGPGSCQTAR